MATFYGATKLTGGTRGALDKINGNKLSDKDAAIVITDDTMYSYQVNTNSNAAENVPYVIVPDHNPGNKRWVLVSSTGASGANDHKALLNIGVYEHTEIDAHIDNDDLHRTISDGTSGATDLWSAQKIQSELNVIWTYIDPIDGGRFTP